MNTRPHHFFAVAVLAGGLALTGCSDTPAEQRSETENKIDKIEGHMPRTRIPANCAARTTSI